MVTKYLANLHITKEGGSPLVIPRRDVAEREAGAMLSGSSSEERSRRHTTSPTVAVPLLSEKDALGSGLGTYGVLLQNAEEEKGD
ncbi:hypothetical protein AAC387_Pa07g1542 [Persea americana]